MVETGEVSQPQVQTEPPNKDACTWAMLCHIAGLAFMVVPVVGGIVGPLIIWQIKKDIHPFVNQSGKEALNFQISMMIYAVIAAFLWFTCIGLALVPVVGIVDIILVIIAAVKAANGEYYHYPLSIRFIS
jgi:uncharacterized Tic20 family protein